MADAQLHLTGLPALYGVDAFGETSAQKHPLGAIGYDKWGRRFRYSQIGGLATVAGHLLQNAARDVQFTDMAVQSDAVAGSESIEVTLGSTATTANMFTEGFLATTAGTGLGYTYPIAGHDVTSGAGTCTFQTATGIKVAVDSSDTKVTAMKNPYDGVIDSPTTATGITVGVAHFIATAAYYTWIGVEGYFATLASTTVQAIGGGVEAKNSSTAGSVNILAAAAYQIGGAPILGVDAEYQIVYFNLP